MRLYIYLFIVLVVGALFIGIFTQQPDPAAASRKAFAQVCEASDIVTAVTRSIDRASIICTCIAGWHARTAPPGGGAFFPTQLYVLKGGDIGAGLNRKTLDTDAQARAACLK